MARRTHKPASNARSAHVLVSRRALCVMSGAAPADLALWEREELIVRAGGKTSASQEPLYDRATVRRARLIRTLGEELGVNLAGIGVILDLLDRLERA